MDKTLTQIERFRSLACPDFIGDLVNVSISPHLFGETQHFLNRDYPPDEKRFFTFPTLRVRNKMFKSLNL